MYFEDNDGSVPVLVASNGFDKIDANDYMGLSAINMGTALKSRISKPSCMFPMT